jgi:hypothetical protein
MHVSQYTRWTAFFRLLRQIGVERVGQWVLAERFEDAWIAHCGLRHDDLRRTLRELVQERALQIHLDTDGAVLELTDRGALMLHGEHASPPLRLTGLFGRLRIRAHTEWVLRKASQRTGGLPAPRLVSRQQDRRRHA